MNDKQKRTAVHLYQLGVYTQGDRYVRKVEPMVYELAGVVYPYRKGNIDMRFFDVFEEENQTKKR